MAPCSAGLVLFVSYEATAERLPAARERRATSSIGSGNEEGLPLRYRLLLLHLKTLLDWLGRIIRAVARLCSFDAAMPGRHQSHSVARNGADGSGRRCKAHRKTRRRSRRNREWRRAQSLILQGREIDGLRQFRDRERLRHRRGAIVIHIARLRRFDSATSRRYKHHCVSGNGACRGGGGRKTDGQTGGSHCTHGERRSVDRLVRERVKGDVLRVLGDGERMD